MRKEKKMPTVQDEVRTVDLPVEAKDVEMNTFAEGIDNAVKKKERKKSKLKDIGPDEGDKRDKHRKDKKNETIPQFMNGNKKGADVQVLDGNKSDYSIQDAGMKKRKSRRRKEASIQAEIPCMDMGKLDPDLVEKVRKPDTGARSLNSRSEKSMDRKRKRKRGRKKKAHVVEQVLDEGAVDPDSRMNVCKTDTHKHESHCQSSCMPEETTIEKRKKRRKRREKRCAIPAEETVEVSRIKSETLETMDHENAAISSRKRKRSTNDATVDDDARVAGMTPGVPHPNHTDRKNGDISFGSRNGEMGSYPKITLPVPVRRKLLVLDVNGLLADIIMPAPKNRRSCFRVYGRAVFTRPFCQDFMEFCFQNFDIGIWSSRCKKVIDRVVDCLLGSLKNKLLFIWNMQHCTQTGFKTLDHKNKPLVCKELRKIWDHKYPNLPWRKGDYDESNTLLLDDSPYKALLNPLNTAIFPNSYCYLDKRDNSLGPGGDLRLYLKGLLGSENVQKYVEQHPFGQRAIDEQDEAWSFYSKILQKLSIPHSSD